MEILDIFKEFDCCNYAIKEPYIIAEAGVNHEGSMEIAKRLVDEAKEGGADAIKFQTYKAHTLASKNSPAYWDTTKEPTKSQYELFKKHDSFWKDEMYELKEYCDKVGIEFMSTPFDIESADFLNEIMDVFKISSSDITNKPFIEYLCQFDKPIILSTGASHLYEIQEAVSWIEKFGNPLALLHCVLNYPTPDENANLGMILGLKKSFPDIMIGYSDHTLPQDMKVCEMATMLGSVIIEKHFTHDKTLPGNDHYHAMDKEDLKLFRENLKRTFEILGSFKVEALEDEEPARQNARRSLVANKDIKEGEIVTKGMLTFKRPASGISPKFIDEVVGKKADKDIIEDEVNEDLFYNGEYKILKKEPEEKVHAPYQIASVKKGRQGERIYSIKGTSITISHSTGGVFSRTGAYKTPKGIRKLSINEVKKLFGFPDNYKFNNVSYNKAISLLGNSVPVNTVKAVIEPIFNNIKSTL